jgi:hypothetical protein
MALGTITPGAAANNAKGAQSAPIFMDKVAIVGDNAYPAGGSTGLDALLATALSRTTLLMITIIAEDCGGYVPVYDDANGGTLKVYEAAADGNPLDEVTATTDLSGTTFNLVAIYK